MENTLENKARFFAQYWGQEIFRYVDKLNKLESDVLRNIGHDYNKLNTSGFLELKSLSNITDEDAITMAHYLKWEGIDDPLEARSLIIGLFIMPANDHRKSQMFFDLSDISSAVDKFRELGYAYKYNDLSVEQQIEYGWITLKPIS